MGSSLRTQYLIKTHLTTCKVGSIMLSKTLVNLYAKLFWQISVILLTDKDKCHSKKEKNSHISWEYHSSRSVRNKTYK